MMSSQPANKNLNNKETKKYFGMTGGQATIILIMGLVVVCLGIILVTSIENAYKPIPTATPTKLNAFITLALDAASDQSRPMVIGTTNLPNGTEILVTVRGVDVDFSAGSNVFVKDGLIKAGPFGPSSGLKWGHYVFEAIMPISEVQTASVRKIIGDHGEYLSGSHVFSEKLGKVVRSNQIDFYLLAPTAIPPTPTPTPVIHILSGGDIGRYSENDELKVTLISAYTTDMIDGYRPSGQWHGGYQNGFTEYLVVTISVDYYGTSYDDIGPSNFHITAFKDDETHEYVAEHYSGTVDTNSLSQSAATKLKIIYIINPQSENFMLCYKETAGVYRDNNKIVGCHRISLIIER